MLYTPVFPCDVNASPVFQAQQQDIESRSKIVSSVLKLCERLQTDLQACANEAERDSLHVVAVNLERRWHAIWLQSLEWQCRLEEALAHGKVSAGLGEVLAYGKVRAGLREVLAHGKVRVMFREVLAHGKMRGGLREVLARGKVSVGLAKVL